MAKTRLCAYWSTILILTVSWLFAQSPAGLLPFLIPSGGAATFVTESDSGPLRVGFTKILANLFTVVPTGLAILEHRQDSILISETAIPASPLSFMSQIYVEADGSMDTGIAIANPNSEPATISFIIRKPGPGVPPLRLDAFTIPPNSQLARFFTEPPFNGPIPHFGFITMFSSVPVAVAALRGFTNERSDFLMTTLLQGRPAAGTFGSVPVQPRVVVGDIPMFADGGGWTTQVVLVNNTVSDFAAGKIEFFSADGKPLNVTVDGQTTSIFNHPASDFSKQRGDILRIFTSGSASDVRVGYIRVTAEAHSASFNAFAILSFKRGGVTVSSTGVPVVRAGNAFRLYVEESGDFAGQVRTGLAISNAARVPINVLLELLDLNGQPTGLTSTVAIPSLGQVSKFVREIPGLDVVPIPFRGTLRISTATPEGISVVGLRGRPNERSDFLFSTVLAQEQGVVTPESVFPHVVEGSGYSTEFVLFNGANEPSSGNLLPVSKNGIRFDFTPRPN